MESLIGLSHITLSVDLCDVSVSLYCIFNLYIYARQVYLLVCVSIVIIFTCKELEATAEFNVATGEAGYLAIFDGHAGDWTASWLARSLHRRLQISNQILGNRQGAPQSTVDEGMGLKAGGCRILGLLKAGSRGVSMQRLRLPLLLSTRQTLRVR